MTEPLPVGIHYGVPVEQYRADKGYCQSDLKAFGKARSPFHFKYEREQPQEMTPALRIGSCVDSAIHDTAEEHMGKFVVWEGARRSGKDWADFSENHASQIILTRDEGDTVSDCIFSLTKHDDTQKILAACHKQVAVIANHAEHGWRLKGLLDLLPDRSRCSDMLAGYAFDLKTAIDASPDGFSDACFKFGYATQAAFYMQLLEYSGVHIETFGFIVVETVPPHQVAIHFIQRGSAEYIYGISQIENLLPRYHKCVSENSWPSYGNEWQAVRFKRYQLQTWGIEREVLT